MFKLLKTSEKSRARRATLTTPHGEVQTPVFMAVGTQATVKSLTPAQVEETGAQIILGNTYHLNIRPTSELISRFGGLHEFMKWRKPILTDSGGFQAFSLSKLRKITEEGIAFNSHLDGAKLFLSPESCMQIQRNLNSDIAMVLDECIPYPCERKACKASVERTIRWAKRCRDEYERLGMPADGVLSFAIAQGGCYDEIRAEGNHLEYLRRRTHAHNIARLFRRKILCADIDLFEHRGFGFAHRNAADCVSREVEFGDSA